MRGAIICSLSLIAACFLVEAFHEAPNYAKALETGWNQLVAIAIYNWLWVVIQFRLEYMFQ